MMNSAFFSEYFKERKVTPFEDLTTTLLVGVATLATGTNIKIENLFNNVPIYEIPGYVRGKNVEVKIPHPGVPYVVLSAKKGDEVRGIVKRLPKKRKGNKGRFPNQVALDISLKEKVVNVMIFSNSMKISGATKPEQLAETLIYMRALLNYVQNQGVHVFDVSPVFSKLDIVMENVVFDLGFRVRGDVLYEKAVASGLESPPDTDAVRVLYPMGVQKTKGGERYYDFRVRHTGKVVYSGNNRKDMKESYDKFMNFIGEIESDIRFL